MTLSLLATPTFSEKRRIPEGVYPLRLNPQMVGIRGSSHPLTNPAYKGKVEYRKENIPQAEDILGRTLVMSISVKMSQEKLDGIRKGIEQAAKNM